MIALLIVLGLATWASFVVILILGFGMSAGSAASGSLVIAIVIMLIDAWNRK